jgi:hypothetical protein
VKPVKLSAYENEDPSCGPAAINAKRRP